MLVGASLAGAAAAVVLSDRQPLTLGNIALAFGGAAVAGVLVRSRPLVAFGVLFFLSSLSSFVIDLEVGGLRVEQPAIATVLAALTIGRLRGRPTTVRPILAIAAAGAVYLATLGLSSTLFAPDVGTSLRIVAWTGISMVGGVAAFLLTRGQGRRAADMIVAAGFATAVGGLVAGIVFYLFGPMTPGIGARMTTVPRVEVWAWEVNLYAIYLAVIVPLAFERFRHRRDATSSLVLAMLLLGLALGVTRGAWLGLGAGMVAMFGVILLRGASRATIGRGLAVAATGAVIGIVLATRLLDPSVQLEHLAAAPRPTPGPGASPGASLAPTPTLQVSTGGTDQTVAFRLDHIRPALDDWKTSPIIGLGAESFGMLHPERTPSGVADHLAIMALAVLHDAGLVGVAGLVVVGWLVARALWRAAADRRITGLAAAFIGSLTVLVVAYQATNALHFALNWLLLGTALGMAVGARAAPSAALE